MMQVPLGGHHHIPWMSPVVDDSLGGFQFGFWPHGSLVPKAWSVTFFPSKFCKYVCIYIYMYIYICIYIYMYMQWFLAAWHGCGTTAIQIHAKVSSCARCNLAVASCTRNDTPHDATIAQPARSAKWPRRMNVLICLDTPELSDFGAKWSEWSAIHLHRSMSFQSSNDNVHHM